MILKINYTKKYKKDYKKLQKQNYNLEKLNLIIENLKCGETLESKYKDHSLYGEYIGCRECHIEPDWLLIYQIKNNNLILILMRTGSHSNLYK